MPSRDWNQLDTRVGKNTETWTLDREQLDDVAFFGGMIFPLPVSGAALAEAPEKLMPSELEL
jgi:hypothetical protein